MNPFIWSSGEPESVVGDAPPINPLIADALRVQNGGELPQLLELATA